MTKLEKFSELLRQMKLDIRLEVILADLVTESLAMEDIVVVSNSLFKRNYHHDIEKITEVEFGHSHRKKLSFVVNREGIYDLLPEDLFHQPSDDIKTIDKDTIIHEMKVQQQLEKASRLFFLPFEQEFFRQRTKLEVEERKFLFETSSDISGDLFNYIWELPDFLDNSQKSKLGILLPVIHKIVGDLEIIRYIVEEITGDHIEFKEMPPREYLLPDEPLLGSMLLGVDGILGGGVSEMQSSITVKIFLSELERLADYMPGGKKIVIHEFLCNLFMPFEKDVVFELDFSEPTVSFIAENETFYLGRLNYTSII